VHNCLYNCPKSPWDSAEVQSFLACPCVAGESVELPDVVAVAAEDDPLPIDRSSVDHQGVAFGLGKSTCIVALDGKGWAGEFHQSVVTHAKTSKLPIRSTDQNGWGCVRARSRAASTTTALKAPRR